MKRGRKIEEREAELRAKAREIMSELDLAGAKALLYEEMMKLEREKYKEENPGDGGSPDGADGED